MIYLIFILFGMSNQEEQEHILAFDFVQRLNTDLMYEAFVESVI